MTRRTHIPGWIPALGLIIIVVLVLILAGCGNSAATGDSGENGNGDPNGKIHYLTTQCVGHVQYGTTGENTLTAVLDPKDCP